MRLRVILEEAGLVAGRTSQTPVIDPDLQSGIVRDVHDVLHYAQVAFPVVVREHMHHKIHPVVHDIAHILLHVAEDPVAVVGSAGAELFFHIGFSFFGF